MAALFALAACTLGGASIDLKHDRWPAVWISHPGALHQFGVYHFRRSFTLPAKPSRFIIHVSADNRYQLFVNSTPVSRGPAAGDLWNWRYETVDIAAQLRAGPNTLAAVVWNFAESAPSSQLTNRTAFLLQGDSEQESIANTSPEWKSMADDAYRPYDRRQRNYPAGELFGAGESVNGQSYPWGWEQSSYDDRSWGQAVQVSTAYPRETRADFNRWFLVEDALPPMEERVENFDRAARTQGVTAPPRFVDGDAPITVAAHQRAVLLLDMRHETVGYPELTVSGGRGAHVQCIYTEALRTPQAGRGVSSWLKGNRDEIDGKEAHGMGDEFIADGGVARLYRPLWWRVFRYVQVSVETGDAPLTLLSFRNQFSAYPFVERASFESSDERLKRIWDVGWRTARLSSHEFFTDGPYYEALQYAGDMRIVALTTLAISGDDRLMRNGIALFDDSRLSNGLTYSRYPTSDPQVIPPYSLIWIDTLHDYWRYRSDSGFVKQHLRAVHSILDWFETRAQANGMPGPLGWWPFVDWVNGWKDGVPPGEERGESAIIALQWAGALRDAAEMERALGDAALAARYEQRRAVLVEILRRNCWDERRGLVADTVAHDSFSQHATLLGVLEDVVPAERQADAMNKVLTDASLSQPTLYFRFYLGRALAKAGLADRYVDALAPWHEIVKLGLTTWPETPYEPRSDCHGWSTSPNYELLTAVAGIEPAEPGFRSVRIAPHLGTLTWVRAAMPHERGTISVDLKRGPVGLQGQVTLPEGLTGNLVEGERTRTLHSGVNTID
jgi:hypothetical protein